MDPAARVRIPSTKSTLFVNLYLSCGVKSTKIKKARIGPFFTENVKEREREREREKTTFDHLRFEIRSFKTIFSGDFYLENILDFLPRSV